MTEKNDSLVERVRSSYQQLSAAATTLNSASDSLGESVAGLDSRLKKLNLGISSWVIFDEGGSEDGYQYFYNQVGYAKVGGKWGIALGTVDGDQQFPEHEKVERWLFSDAPRYLRIRAVPKIPDLLDKLTKDAAKMTSEISEQAGEVRQLVSAISTLVDDQVPEKPRKGAGRERAR